MSKKRNAIGIDLGTTFSCVGVWKNGRVEIITNKGNRTTASVVAFKEVEREGKKVDECVVGEEAKNMVSSNPEATLYDVKRLIGRRFNDPVIEEDMKQWPFKVVDKDGWPRLQVTYKSEVKTFTPEEVSSYVLLELKRCAARFLEVDKDAEMDAVITVPAYFNDSQRNATIDAGRLAGLHVLRVLNEPTSAALAYGLDKKGTKSNIIIFDFGGGTLDVSLLTLDKGEFTVRATAGDTHLGGEDINAILVNYFAADFERSSGKDLLKDCESSDPNVRRRARYSLSRLRSSCENAKRLLSSTSECEVNFVYKGEDYFKTITRACFEKLCADIFRRCMIPLDKVLSDAHMTKSDIDDVVLVGGSTRIPRIQKMVGDYFGKKEFNQTVSPDEAVACGAAIQARILTNPDDGLGDVRLVDVNPLSLGIEIIGQVMTVVVRRNTTIPCRRSHIFTTVCDNQRTVDFRVFEGESGKTTENHLLGNFLLTGIPPEPAGEPKFEVVFYIDENGILEVTARDTRTGNMNRIQIKDSQRLSAEEFKKLKK